MDRRQLHAKALSYITMNAVVKTVNIGQAHHMLNDSWIYESTIFFSKNFYVLFFYKVEIFYSGPPEHGEDWSFTNGPFSLLRPLLPPTSEFMGKTFQAAQLTNDRFLTIDHSFSEFLEAHLRSNKGIFVLFLLNLWV